MYTDMYTVTKGHLYSPVEYLQWFYCHFVSFSKGYKIQPVNKLDFRFKATAVSSETIFRNLILRTLNILQPSKVHFCKKEKKNEKTVCLPPNLCDCDEQHSYYYQYPIITKSQTFIPMLALT